MTHEITTDHDTLQSVCSCGAKAATTDIRRHIEDEQSERDRPVVPTAQSEPEPEPAATDHAVGEPAVEEKPKRTRRPRA